MLKFKFKNSSNGSILIFVTLVLAMTAIYMSTVLFDIRGSIDQERIYKTKKQMDYLRIAIVDFRLNNPDLSLTSLDDLVEQPMGFPDCDLVFDETFRTMQIPLGWCGPYIDTSLFLGSVTAYREDAWGTPFELDVEVVNDARVYTLTSCGENAECGEAEPDEDDLPLSF